MDCGHWWTQPAARDTRAGDGRCRRGSRGDRGHGGGGGGAESRRGRGGRRSPLVTPRASLDGVRLQASVGPVYSAVHKGAGWPQHALQHGVHRVEGGEIVCVVTRSTSAGRREGVLVRRVQFHQRLKECGGVSRDLRSSTGLCGVARCFPPPAKQDTCCENGRRTREERGRIRSGVPGGTAHSQRAVGSWCPPPLRPDRPRGCLRASPATRAHRNAARPRRGDPACTGQLRRKARDGKELRPRRRCCMRERFAWGKRDGRPTAQPLPLRRPGLFIASSPRRRRVAPPLVRCLIPVSFPLTVATGARA